MSYNYSDKDPLKERIMGLGLGEGIKYGVSVGALSSAGVTYMVRNNALFRKSTSVSTRVAIPTMLSLFVFGVAFELTLISCQRFPEKWGLASADEEEEEANHREGRRKAVIPFHHKLMNGVYDHPFVAITVMGAPIAGLILHSQLKMKHITFSQRIMHSRVYAQVS